MGRLNPQAVQGGPGYAGDAENMQMPRPRQPLGYIPEVDEGPQAVQTRRAPVLSRVASLEDRMQLLEQHVNAGFKELAAANQQIRAELIG